MIVFVVILCRDQFFGIWCLMILSMFWKKVEYQWWSLQINWKIKCWIRGVLVMKGTCIHNSSLFLQALWNAVYQQLKSDRAVSCSLQICKGWFEIRSLVWLRRNCGYCARRSEAHFNSFSTSKHANLATKSTEVFSSWLIIWYGWDGSLQAECWSQHEAGRVKTRQRKGVLGWAGPLWPKNTTATVELSLPRRFFKTVSTI